MNGAHNQPRDVARRIEEAFADVPYPGDDHLVVGWTPEDVEIASFLRGRRWQNLPLEWLARNHEVVFFMTPEALRFYLPAYLIASLLHYDQAGNIPSSVMFLLELPSADDSDGQGRFQARFEPLSRRQREAIKAFIEYLRDEHGEAYPEDTSPLLRWWASDSQKEPC